MVSGILSGDEVREAAEALPAARERLEELRQQSVAYQGALEKLHREVVSCVEQHAEEYAGDVRAKATEQLAEVEAATSRLQQLMSGLEVLGSLADWVERPQKSFNYGQPRGELFAGILEDARACKALPREKRAESIAIQHPGHSAPKGPVPDWLAPALRR
jgi:hypothetical protein